jgi:hypothetical protein
MFSIIPTLLLLTVMAEPPHPTWPPRFNPIRNNSIQGPSSSADIAEWWANVSAWRDEQRSHFNTTSPGNALNDPQLAWARTSFVQAQVPLYDRFLFDRATGRYTVARFLGDLRARYGGLDAILLWGTYPNMGIDDRDQFDTWASSAGGLSGLANLTADLQAAGVRVFFPMVRAVTQSPFQATPHSQQHTHHPLSR